MDDENLQPQHPALPGQDTPSPILPPPVTEWERQEVRRLIRWLPRGHRIRQHAETLLRGAEREQAQRSVLSDREIAEVFQCLHDSPDRRWRERAAAVWILGRSPLDGEQRRVAMEYLTGILRQRRQHSLACCCASGCMFGWAWFIWIPLVLYTLFMDSRINTVRAAAATALGWLQIPEAVGEVAAAVNDSPGTRQTPGTGLVREAALNALPFLLDALTVHHYGRLPDQAITNLCRLLDHPNDRLVLDVLEALGRVGGGSAVEPVERVARRGRAYTKQTAERILPILWERQRREREAATLLRPSIAPDDPSQVLLRPAQDTGQTDVNLLLRPADGEET